MQEMVDDAGLLDLLTVDLGDLYNSFHKHHQYDLGFCRHSPVALLRKHSLFWGQWDSVTCAGRLFGNHHNIKDVNYHHGIGHCVGRDGNEPAII